MTTLNISLDEEMERELTRLAVAKHRSKSELVRELLRRDLALEAFEEARAKLVPLASIAGYLTDEDVFQDIS